MLRFAYSFVLVTLILTTQPLWADTAALLRTDLEKILGAAKLSPQSIQFDLTTQADKNLVAFQCNTAGQLLMSVKAKKEELVSTFYYGLHKLGFYFPHPREQVSPSADSIKSNCGKSFEWRPSLAYRGFHLHTQHPNEWVAGFFNGDSKITSDIIYWLARNFQNVLQVQLLNNAAEVYSVHFLGSFKLASELQLRTGVVVSLSSQQQKSFRLIPLWRAYTTFGSHAALMREVERVLRLFQIDFLTVELGSTEFTALPYKSTIEWLNSLGAHLRTLNKFLLVRAHAPINQFDDDYGNYNFIAQHTNPVVGVLPHTVMFYGLTDDHSPVYGRKNFSDMADFMFREAKLRVTWYHPETSYFVGMDLDTGLYFTDYLRARTQDYKLIVDNGIRGHLNFTSGQELGHWLFDWNVALQSNLEYLGKELISLQLLGEDTKVWQKILDFQNQHFKQNELYSVITFENPMDHLPFFEPVHSRTVLQSLFRNESQLRHEIQTLTTAILNIPDVSQVKNIELQTLLRVTHLRLEHARSTRLAILNKFSPEIKLKHLKEAETIRIRARELMQTVQAKFDRYPTAKLFQKFENPTSYKYGYGWPAVNLYFWEREERVVDTETKNPFFMSIYDPLEILF